MKLLVKTSTGAIMAASNLGGWSHPVSMQIVDVAGDADTYDWPHNKGPTSCRWDGASIVKNASVSEDIPTLARSTIISRLLDKGWGQRLHDAFESDIIMKLKWNSEAEQIPITHVDFRTFLSTELGINPDAVMWVGTQVVQLPNAPSGGIPPSIGQGAAVDSNTTTAPSSMPIQGAPLNWNRLIYDNWSDGNVGLGTRWTAAYVHKARWLNDEIGYFVDPVEQASLGYNPFSVVQEDGKNFCAIQARPTPSADVSRVSGKLFQTGVLSNHLHGGNQSYGYYELFVKLPNVKGVWPAFWTLTGTSFEAGDHRWPPEIDILEWPNNQVENASDRYFVNAHWVDTSRASGRNASGGWFTVSGNLLTGAYISCLWTPKFIAYYCNGVLFRQTTNPVDNGIVRGVHSAMHCAINLAIGGSWATNPSTTSPGFPCQYKFTEFSMWNMP